MSVWLAQAAVRAYTSSLEGRTDDARVWANRSAAHLSAGAPAAALEDARIARALDPAYAKVQTNLARRPWLENPETTACRHVQHPRGVRMRLPDLREPCWLLAPQAWYREGAAQEALQQWEPAAQAYFEAFRLEPDAQDFSQV